MANTNKLNISELDFDTIKTNLKNFLSSQTEFQDYNFEGSSLSILLDILSYNTHYLSYIANVTANEIFLDSADIRNNIVSLAKMIGYTPSSVRAPRASVDVRVNNAKANNITMAKGTTFTTSVDGTSYTYLNNEDITINAVDGVFNFADVTLYEGTLATFKYTVNNQDTDQKFIIPNNRADTSTLKVIVQNSTTDTTQTTYSLSTDLVDVDNTSKVYFIQEGNDGKFEIYFGDGVVGFKPVDGNIVILEYIVTNAQESNGAGSFSLSGNVGGFTDVTITTNSVSQGGSQGETKESIKFNAPLYYSTQNRAVTTSDYETLVKQLYPNAISVSAWGGEDDEIPIFGVVKIAIKAASGSTLTTQTKSDIVTKLQKYNVASVRPDIVDPETTSVELSSTVKYNANATSKSAETLKAEIINKLNAYNTGTLQKFDGVFRYSKVTGLIDNTDNSILSNITTLKIRKTFTPLLSTSTKYQVYFRNALFHPHAGHLSDTGGILASSGFKVDGDTANVYYLDDDGNGNIRRWYYLNGVKTVINATQGTIDYATGTLTINSLNIASVENIRGATSTAVEVTVVPSSNDVVPVRNQIIELDTANSAINVQSDTFVGGSSDAGVGYTTSTSYSSSTTY